MQGSGHNNQLDHMGQQVIVNHAMHGTRRKKKVNQMTGRSYRSKTHNRSSLLQLLLASKTIAAGAAALVILISIYTNLTSLQFFWLEVVPSLWRLMCGLFTPTNLFILLNFLILTIFALAHLRSTTSCTHSAAVNHSHDERPIPTSDHDYSGNDAVIHSHEHPCSDPNYSGSDGSPYDLQRDGINHTGRHSGAGAGQAHTLDIEDRADSADQLTDNNEVSANHALKCREEGDNQDDKAMATASATAAGLMINEVIAENTSVHKIELYCSRSGAEGEAGKAGGKAEKAASAETDWQRPVDDKFIEALLSEEGSIFTRAQSRPLASARFTRKKATSANDRPLSPLRISKPILKRGDTLEATWKAICESKRHSSPFNRHYPKHTTTNEGIYIDGGKPRSSLLSPIKQRSKFLRHDHELTRAQLMRKREPSMPNEELNAKVESFISRFNAQIKIQREKSLLEFMEMVGRGAS